MEDAGSSPVMWDFKQTNRNTNSRATRRKVGSSLLSRNGNELSSLKCKKRELAQENEPVLRHVVHGNQERTEEDSKKGSKNEERVAEDSVGKEGRGISSA